MSYLSVQNISKTYAADEGPVQVLSGITFSLEKQGVHALVGPSGCGKSTFLMICGSLIHPDAGEVLIDGQNLLAMSSGQRARSRADLIGYVFQQFHLIPYLTIEQNILAASLATQGRQVEKRCHQLIDELGLSHRIRHIPGKLSSGEQQRVALARALLNNPKMVIADEPTGNLDDENGKAVLGVLRNYADQGGLVMMATHDKQVAALADATYRVSMDRIEPFDL